MSLSLRPNERTYLDSESRVIVFQGASVNQLAEMFNLRNVDVMRRLAGLDPVGVGRQGNPIYKVSAAASRLIKIPITEEMIIEYMGKLNPKQLPPLLNKLFWDAMASRRKYEEQVGELWNTADVVAVASDAFQSLRMSMLLIPDRLRDETSITEAQVLLVQNVIDSALEAARERLVTDLRKSSGSRSGPDEPEEEPL